MFLKAWLSNGIKLPTSLTTVPSTGELIWTSIFLVATINPTMDPTRRQLQAKKAGVTCKEPLILRLGSPKNLHPGGFPWFLPGWKMDGWMEKMDKNGGSFWS